MTTFVLSGAALLVAGTAYRFVSGVWHAVAVEEADRRGAGHAPGTDRAVVRGHSVLAGSTRP
jgi:hypothetical protein